MKLHLPVKLMRAVLAVLVSHAVVSTSWADDKDKTITAHAEYTSSNYVSDEWKGGDALTITTVATGEESPDLSFSGIGESVISSGQVKVSELGDLLFTNNSASTSETPGIQGAAISSSGQVILNNNKSVTFGISGEQSSGNRVASTAESQDPGNSSNTRVDFAKGGAISAHGVEISGTKEDINFSYNSAYSEKGFYIGGGAIYSTGIEAIKEDNKTVDVNYTGKISIAGNLGNIIFDSNSVNSDNSKHAFNTEYYAVGGALDAMGVVEIVDNYGKLISFAENKVVAGKAHVAGAAISSYGSVVISGNKNSKLEFLSNSVSTDTTACGGAISADNYYFVRSANSSLLGINLSRFDEIEVEVDKLVESSVTLSDNGDILFSDNGIICRTSDNGRPLNGVFGGAIYSKHNININNNGDVSYLGNNIALDSYKIAAGGALYSKKDINFSDNSELKFEGNYVDVKVDVSTYVQGTSVKGGAICSEGNITIGGYEENGNGDVSFVSNTVHTQKGNICGGAIAISPQSEDSYKSLYVSYNEGVTFFNNKAITESVHDALGGAIYVGSERAIIEISSNTGNVTFEENVAQGGDSANGGAICAVSSNSSISICENAGNVSFINNVARGGESGAAGGAIAYSMGVTASSASVELLFNTGSIVFDGNKTYASATSLVFNGGAAIFSPSNDILIGLNGNVSFTNNQSFNIPTTTDITSDINMGGALTTLGTLQLSYNNGDVIFSNNGLATQRGQYVFGGAIYATQLSMVGNNGNVTFSGNYEATKDATILRSIVVGGFTNEAGRVELAANKGQSITFYDSVYVAQSSNDETPAILNYYYDQVEGTSKATAGDIIFSGARTATDLAEVYDYLNAQSAGETGTFVAADIDVESSLTSTICRDVYVAAGSLQVVDGAVLRLVNDPISNIFGETSDVNKKYTLYVVDGIEMAPSMGVEYTPDLSAKLVVSGGSKIEAGEIYFGSTAQLIAKESEAFASTVFSLNEAAAQTAVMEADTITLTGGMICTLDGAYLDLSGVDALSLDASNGQAITFRFGEDATMEKGGKLYFVVFTGYKELNAAIIQEGWYTHNLSDKNLQDVAMGYDDKTGTLYFSATAPVPEPTTATLSLLALAGLAARRRRRK